MTDRVKALTVVLEEDYRIDDLEDTLIPAIKLLRGVLDVRPEVVNIDYYIIHQRTRAEILAKLHNVLKYTPSSEVDNEV